MKFITIALVVQFLLSCWPKTNIIRDGLGLCQVCYKGQMVSSNDGVVT